MLISLVGLPGGGKTSTGRLLAKRLSCPFVDSDAIIEARLGESIADFFVREGEDRFRDVEAEVVDELARGFAGVLATGGGVVLREANRLVLRRHSTVVYLTATPELLLQRLRYDTKRPLLRVADRLSRLQELHRARDPLYRKIAHYTVATGRPSISALVVMLLSQLELGGVVDPSKVPSDVDPLGPG